VIGEKYLEKLRELRKLESSKNKAQKFWALFIEADISVKRF
jgi:hypothetical protein